MLVDRLSLSERRACEIPGQHRSTQRHEPKLAGDEARLRGRPREISRAHPRWGYRRAHAQLLVEGWSVNRKRCQRISREEGLRVPKKARKRRRVGESTAAPTGSAPSAPTTSGRSTSNTTRPPTAAS